MRVGGFGHSLFPNAVPVFAATDMASVGPPYNGSSLSPQQIEHRRARAVDDRSALRVREGEFGGEAEAVIYRRHQVDGMDRVRGRAGSVAVGRAILALGRKNGKDVLEFMFES
jgi:hypothetical protein